MAAPAPGGRAVGGGDLGLRLARPGQPLRPLGLAPPPARRRAGPGAERSGPGDGVQPAGRPRSCTASARRSPPTSKPGPGRAGRRRRLGRRAGLGPGGRERPSRAGGQPGRRGAPRPRAPAPGRAARGRGVPALRLRCGRRSSPAWGWPTACLRSTATTGASSPPGTTPASSRCSCRRRPRWRTTPCPPRPKARPTPPSWGPSTCATSSRTGATARPAPGWTLRESAPGAAWLYENEGQRVLPRAWLVEQGHPGARSRSGGPRTPGLARPGAGGAGAPPARGLPPGLAPAAVAAPRCARAGGGDTNGQDHPLQCGSAGDRDGGRWGGPCWWCRTATTPAGGPP